MSQARVISNATILSRAAPIVVQGIAGLRRHVGTTVGSSPWVSVDQASVSRFGTVTFDRNPLHVDVEAARAAGFDGTIVHGFLSLALVAGLMSSVLRVDHDGAVLNYGVDRVRFPAPVRVGARVRLTMAVAVVAEAEHHTDVTYRCVVEVEGQERPGCVAGLILRYL